MRRPSALAAATLLAALAAATRAGAEDPWARALKKRGVDPERVENPVAVTSEVERAAFEYAGGGGGEIEQLRRIQSALYDPARFNLVYDADATLTAREALEQRRGNCVASTSLFIALARARGIKVRAGYVTPRDLGEKRGDLVVVTTHVVAVYQNATKAVVFDFYREREDPSISVALIDDLALAALYLNNRAVTSLQRGDLESAAEELEIVTRLAPQFVAAHANLGVLRRRLGEIDGAFDAYRAALAIDPRNPAVLGNLAALYVSLGRERDARAALALADLSSATPYVILARGDLEMADGRFDDALRFYRKAARVGPKLAEPHLAIARLEQARGHPEEARRAVNRALHLAPGHPEATSLDAALDPTGSP